MKVRGAKVRGAVSVLRPGAGWGIKLQLCRGGRVKGEGSGRLPPLAAGRPTAAAPGCEGKGGKERRAGASPQA